MVSGRKSLAALDAASTGGMWKVAFRCADTGHVLVLFPGNAIRATARRLSDNVCVKDVVPTGGELLKFNLLNTLRRLAPVKQPDRHDDGMRA
jgi:hypothetical protein